MALYGLDLSDNQTTDVVRQAKDFVILRATYGTGFVDPDCDNKYQLAEQLGLKIGVYHVCYNRLNSAVDEANWFADNIQGYLGKAIPFVDNERWVSKANGALLNDPTDVAWQEAFNAQFYARTKVRNPEYMNANNTGLADWSPIAATNALWCAGYPAEFDVANPPLPKEDGSDMPYNTGAWPFATFWQYSSSAGTLDRDIFYGTSEAWDKFAMGDRQVAAPAPVVTPPPITVSGSVTDSGTTTTESTTSTTSTTTTTLPPKPPTNIDGIIPVSTPKPVQKPSNEVVVVEHDVERFVITHYNKTLVAVGGLVLTFLNQYFSGNTAIQEVITGLTAFGVFQIPNTKK